jgi:hypothetical protein
MTLSSRNCEKKGINLSHRLQRMTLIQTGRVNEACLTNYRF